MWKPFCHWLQVRFGEFSRGTYNRVRAESFRTISQNPLPHRKTWSVPTCPYPSGIDVLRKWPLKAIWYTYLNFLKWIPVSVVVIFFPSITLACFIHLSLWLNVMCRPSLFVSPNFEKALNCSLNCAVLAVPEGGGEAAPFAVAANTIIRYKRSKHWLRYFVITVRPRGGLSGERAARQWPIYSIFP